MILRNLSLAIALSAYTITSSVAEGRAKDIGVSVLLGETLAPSHYRIKVKSLDVGYEWRSDWYYVGSRVWKKSLYAGMGVGGGTADVGVVGMFGAEWKPLKHLALSYEFFAMGSSAGRVMSIGFLGVSILW